MANAFFFLRVNRATLLLAHSPSQIRNQERMENYISATSAAVTSFSSQADLPVTSPNHSSDLRPHTPDNVPTVAGTEEQNGRHDDTGSLSSGRTITNSNPRALATRLRLLELYVLHILPHNEEWELAHHFIQSSADLDDDKREAFLQALQALAEQQRQTHMRQEELGRQKQMQQQQSVRPSRIEPPSNRPVTENTPYSASASSTRPPPPLADSAGRLGAAKGKRERQQQKQGGDARSERRQTQSPQPPSRLHKNGGAQDKISGVDATAAASPTPSHKPTPLQLAMAIMARSLKTYAHPSTAMRLLRSLLFTLILITLLARRDIRQTLRSLLNGARLKVGQTVKMAIIAN